MAPTVALVGVPIVRITVSLPSTNASDVIVMVVVPAGMTTLIDVRTVDISITLIAQRREPDVDFTPPLLNQDKNMIKCTFYKGFLGKDDADH